MRRNGFSIIELMIAFAISGLLLSLLYQIFKQTTIGVQRTESSVDATLALARLEDVLRNDLMCAYIPRQFSEQDPSPVEQKFFFSQNEQNGLKRLSFITTNVLASYGESSAHGVRIMYSLEQSQVAPELFTLKRQQSTHFDLKAFERGQARAYTVADRIKEITTTFMILKKPKEGEKQTAPQYEEFSVWEQDAKKEQIFLPDAILIKGILVDERMQEHAFELRCLLYSRPFALPKKQDTKTTSTATTTTAVAPKPTGAPAPATPTPPTPTGALS